jgi:3-deoxy-D-manno-octulosonic-acid transferase
MFFYIYTVLITLLYIISTPFLIIASFKSKYKTSIWARFFLYKNRALKPNGIWFHVCSFGEAKAIKVIVDALDRDKLRLTTTTQTGKSVIDTYAKQSRYLPFEILLFSWIKPQQALVVMEAEFWYLMFLIAKKKGAKTLLINARMSDKSYPKYLKMRWFYKELFKYVDRVYAQSDIDKERLESLGARDVCVIGNIKLANIPKPTKYFTKLDSLVVCGASTHKNEEEIILKAYIKLKNRRADAKLLLVPRHPERFDSVYELGNTFATKYGLSIERFSNGSTFESDIVIVDMLGELINIYAISDVVIIGGSFEPIGGHNVAEASQFGCKIISGEHYFNQRDIYRAVSGIEVVSKDTLSQKLLEYESIAHSKIEYKTDIEEILRELR